MDSIAADNLTTEDLALLDCVEPSLAAGFQLKAWWEETEAANSYAERFELVRTFNRPDVSFGFFDEAPVGGEMLRVMGDVQEMLFDRPKEKSTDWRDEVREFVLRYFLRVTQYTQPMAYAEPGACAQPAFLQPLSWCPTSKPARRGFGYSQLFYKLRSDGSIGKFPDQDRFAIIDLRELDDKYEWVVLKVQLLDFKLSFALLGDALPEVAVPLKEETVLVLSREFIVTAENPEPGVLGIYSLGYALVDPPSDGGPLVYGPGRFGAGFQIIQFRVLENCDTRVSMSFVVNRPQQILNVSVDPVEAALEAIDFLSGGVATRLLGPVRNAIGFGTASLGSFDPVTTYISCLNFMTGGWASERLCVSKEQLEKRMLVQHFMRHYEMIVGSLLTWRQIPNWLDFAALPDWVIRGAGQ